MIAKIEKYGAYTLLIVTLIAVVSLGFHFWNPIKGLFGSNIQQAIIVEQTPEYKKLQDEFIQSELDKKELQGEVKQLTQDKQDILDGLKNIKPVYINNVKQIKNQTPTERDALYKKNLAQQNRELEAELK